MAEFEISRLEDLDPYRYEQALRELDMGPDPDEEGIVYCRAFAGNDEIGHLIIDARGLILGVEVAPEHRRKGIATAMLAELRRDGYQVVHDWENMRDDGAAWVASLGEPRKSSEP